MARMQSPWQVALQSVLQTDIKRLSRLGGGDFAESYQAVLSSGETVFIKTHKQPPPNFFSTEAAGLKWLRDTGTVSVPEVLAYSDAPPLLALQWIETGNPDAHTEEAFGRALAALHQTDFPSFGRPDERTTGSQGLPNQRCEDWATFYGSQRLLPLAKVAAERNALPADAISMLESVAARLIELGGPDEPPSLLHGDLWAGNRLVDRHGCSWLIDPAAHGGHREFDLAMMRLFGGYGDRCFAAYQEVSPLAPGWADRVALHQLAPLTVHAIKFGGAYRSATAEALRQYC